MKRTLLDDLEKIYYSIKCEKEDNSYCKYCNYCKNKLICDTTLNLIVSIRNIYYEVKNENQEDDTIRK